MHLQEWHPGNPQPSLYHQRLQNKPILAAVEVKGFRIAIGLHKHAEPAACL